MRRLMTMLMVGALALAQAEGPFAPAANDRAISEGTLEMLDPAAMIENAQLPAALR